MAITKQDAAILFAYSFKLVDKEGKVYSIDGVGLDGIRIYSEGEEWHCSLDANQIGTDYWILKRPESQLTKTILQEGKEIVPLIEIAKIAFPDEEWTIESEDLVSCMNFDFGYRYKSFLASGYAWKSVHVKNQEQLFQKLYSLHFIDLPEGTYLEMD